MWLEVEEVVAAPRPAVWAVLTDWERQPEWMADARAVQVLTPRREGVGVVVRCPTNLLGITVQDLMRVTGWEEARRLEIVHLGAVITGTGAFELEDWGGSTWVRWWEEIHPPGGAIGERVAASFVLPILRRLFARSLARFGRLVEAGIA